MLTNFIAADKALAYETGRWDASGRNILSIIIFWRISPPRGPWKSVASLDAGSTHELSGGRVHLKNLNNQKGFGLHIKWEMEK